MDKSVKIGVFAFVATAGILAIPAIAQQPEGDPARPARHMQEPMTRAALETRLQERFARLDADSDGAVTEAEIGAGREARSDRRGERAFEAIDTDSDGSISRAEFDAHHADRAGGERRGRRNAMRRGNRGERMLSRADADSDGRLTFAEMSTGALERFDRSDADRDGTVTPEERRAAREARRAERRDNDAN